MASHPCIKLSIAYSDTRTQMVFANHIVSLEWEAEYTLVYTDCPGHNQFFVKETPDEITALIRQAAEGGG